MTPEDPVNATIRRALERMDQRAAESLRRRSYTWALFVAAVQTAALRAAARL